MPRKGEVVFPLSVLGEFVPAPEAPSQDLHLQSKFLAVRLLSQSSAYTLTAWLEIGNGVAPMNQSLTLP